jgi:antitoxin component of RelBE/YafQ-DinJ toxin-antitoxin module
MANNPDGYRDVLLTIRVPHDMRESAHEVARERELTLSQLLRWMLRDVIAEEAAKRKLS